MTVNFSGLPSDSMKAFELHVQTALGASPNADYAFRDALICLVGLHDRQAETALVDEQVLRQFRRESCEALMKFEKKLRAYSDLTLFIAEGANDGEWYALCMRRSVIQLLLDDYAGTPVADFIDVLDVAELDVEMRRVGQEQGPVPKSFEPRGLPESHWWWRFGPNKLTLKQD